MGERGASRGELAIAASVVLLISALFVVVASVHGAFGAARNDDWSYYRIAFTFADDRRFHLDGWVQTMLVGHTVLAWPVIEVFGHSIKALQIVSVVVGALGIWSCYALLRRVLSAGWTAVACLAVLVGPVFGSLAVSHMTDTTAFTAQVVTLLVGVRAVESRPISRGLLVASAIAGLVAFSIREYAIVAFPAVLGIAWARLRDARRPRTRLRGLAVAFAASAVTLFLWRRSLANSISPTFDTRPGPADLRDLAQFVATLGFFISPVVVAISPIRASARAWAASRVTTVAALGVAVGCLVASRVSFSGNYLTAVGSYTRATVVNTQPAVIPGPLFTLARFVGAYAVIVAALLIACAVAEVRPLLRGRDTRLGLVRAAAGAPAVVTALVFATSLAALYVVFIAAMNGPFFDRYVIVLVPFVAGLMVVAGLRYDAMSSIATVAASAGLALIAALGFVFVDAAATTDGAKWRAANRLAEEGFAPETINGGYEWFGFHQLDDVTLDDSEPGESLGIRIFSPRPVCATVVLNGNEHGARQTEAREELLSRVDARTLLGRRLIVMSVRGPDECD